MENVDFEQQKVTELSKILLKYIDIDDFDNFLEDLKKGNFKIVTKKDGNLYDITKLFVPSDVISFGVWLYNSGWHKHSSGQYWYKNYKDFHQWPPDETCSEEELIQKWEEDKKKK